MSVCAGTFLNEEQLTTELSLSRTPVRDALGRLEQEGLLEIRPKCGILVRPLTLNDIDMTFEVRMLYEPYNPDPLWCKSFSFQTERIL